ncbi:hypothetical protein NDU88_002779 [Pleurodeles waltl]|uniref:Uncharacterized protein n=1 Tax=Pleurodeles waltl TaxID=8319 RepID=A0AAV7UY87_PLEWA|nr:hypothetical protein NDU88_002779 [Pleurodeles waltl]
MSANSSPKAVAQFNTTRAMGGTQAPTTVTSPPWLVSRKSQLIYLILQSFTYHSTQGTHLLQSGPQQPGVQLLSRSQHSSHRATIIGAAREVVFQKLNLIPAAPSALQTAHGPTRPPKEPPAKEIQLTTHSVQQSLSVHHHRRQDPTFVKASAHPSSQLISIRSPSSHHAARTIFRVEREPLTQARATLSGGTSYNRPGHTCLLLTADAGSTGTGTQCRSRAPRGRSPTRPPIRPQEGEPTTHLFRPAATPANGTASPGGATREDSSHPGVT